MLKVIFKPTPIMGYSLVVVYNTLRPDVRIVNVCPSNQRKISRRRLRVLYKKEATNPLLR